MSYKKIKTEVQNQVKDKSSEILCMALDKFESGQNYNEFPEPENTEEAFYIEGHLPTREIIREHKRGLQLSRQERRDKRKAERQARREKTRSYIEKYKNELSGGLYDDPDEAKPFMTPKEFETFAVPSLSGRNVAPVIIQTTKPVLLDVYQREQKTKEQEYEKATLIIKETKHYMEKTRQEQNRMLVTDEVANIIPKIGDKIYVDTCLYIEHGENDIDGGIAEISEVNESDFLPKNHINYYMVSFKGLPMRFNYRILLESQEQLKAEFGDQQAKHIPDYNNHDERGEWKQLR